MAATRGVPGPFLFAQSEGVFLFPGAMTGGMASVVAVENPPSFLNLIAIYF